MSLVKRNRLDAGYELEPRVMLAGSVPGAEAPVANETDASAETDVTSDAAAVAETDAATEAEAVDDYVEEVAAEETPADDVAPAAEDAVAEDAAAEETTAEEVVTEEANAEEVVAEETAADEIASEDVTAPAVDDYAEEGSAEEASAEVVAVQEATVDDVVADEAPVAEAPVEEAPVDEAPVEEAPVEVAPVEEAAAELTRDQERDARRAEQDAERADRDAAREIERAERDAQQDAERELRQSEQDAERLARDEERDAERTDRRAEQDAERAARDAEREAEVAARRGEDGDSVEPPVQSSDATLSSPDSLADRPLNVDQDVAAEETVVEDVASDDTGVVVPASTVFDNPVDSSIVSDATAVETGSLSEVNNAGEIAGAVNGVSIPESTTLNNSGVISSDSRSVEILTGSTTVNNDGAIVGTDDQRDGTLFAGGDADDFEINNSGLIDAGEGNQGSGISSEVDGGRFFVANNDGLIQGRGDAEASSPLAGDGIRFEADATGAEEGDEFFGEINNSGLIDSEGQNGTVAGVRAVDGVGFQGELNNAGVISGDQNGVYFGDADNSGGVVNNTGLISSDSRAVNIDGEGLEVNNSGGIVGTGDQRNGTVYSDATAQDFAVNNSGLIDAGEGNEGAGFSAELSEEGNTFDINNDGAIQGRGDAAAGTTLAGDGVRLERTRVDGALDGSTTGQFDGVINNDGLIDSEGANGTVAGVRAVDGVDFQGQLNNSGVISGVQNGVYLGEGDHTGGVVNNAGLISSDSRAVNIDGEGLEVNNSGDILGTGDQRNGTVYSDATAQDFTVNNSGLIDAGEGNQGAGFSAELSEEGNTFAINNASSGVIQGRGDAAAGTTLAGDGIRLERTRVDGALDGSTTGAFDGIINNQGDISSEGTDGTVAGIRIVDGVDFQGEILNDSSSTSVFSDEQATISGTQNGVYFGEGDHTGGVLNNTLSSTISSDSRALNIDGTGLEVNNDGAILGTGDQRNGTVYADATAQDFTFTNNNLVDAGFGNQGAGFSAELSEEGNTFVLENNGLIQGQGDAAAGSALAGDAIRLERTRVDGALDGSTTGLFDGTIENNAVISSEGANGAVAGFRAVDGVDFQGEFDNNGLIVGTQNGVYFGEGDHTGGVFNNNEGVAQITSDSRAVNIDGTGLEFNNDGEILATDRQRNGTVYVDGTADQFVVNNSGSIDAGGFFDGDGAGSGVSVEVGSEAGDIQSGVITNTGEIFGAGDLAEDAGIRLAAGAEGGVTFAGDITNSGLVSAETDNAILIEEGVNFEGDVINSGTIDGGVDLASGDLVLTDESIVYLDVDSASATERINTQDDVTLGGALNVRFEEGFVPEVGQTFDFIDSNATFGSFSSVSAEGVEFDTANLAVDGTVVVLSNGAMAVVEDGEMVIIAEPGDAAVAEVSSVASDSIVY